MLRTAQILPLECNPGMRQVGGSRAFRGHDATVHGELLGRVGELQPARQTSAADLGEGEQRKTAQPLRLTTRCSAGDECLGQACSGLVEIPGSKMGCAFRTQDQRPEILVLCRMLSRQCTQCIPRGSDGSYRRFGITIRITQLGSHDGGGKKHISAS